MTDHPLLPSIPWQDSPEPPDHDDDEYGYCARCSVTLTPEDLAEICGGMCWDCCEEEDEWPSIP